MLAVSLNLVILLQNIIHISSLSLPESANLLQFRETLSEPSQLLLPWNQSTSHCEWKGVSCYPNNNFHVKSLNLSGFDITGNLKNSISSLCQLPKLLLLDLSLNNFTGDIPPEFGNCSQLQSIYLHNNGITGPILSEILQTKQLLELNLGFNFISGMIPPEIGLCTNITSIELNNNLLFGEIPEEIFSSPNLEFLDLSGNHFSALPEIPTSCSVSELWIYDNQISGSLPLTLRNCNKLISIYAMNNSLGGIIQPEIFESLKQLQVIYLIQNNLEGEIPDTLWNLPNLYEVALSFNKLNGTISEKIGQCRNISRIYLSSNYLTNQIPESIGNLTNLKYLSLGGNMLSGPIPPELGNCSSLVAIDLTDNIITGTIPKEICNLKYLQILYLFRNQIVGQIPPEIGKLSSLGYLSIQANSLIGKIPHGIANLTRLVRLNLAENSFSGSIPSGLCTGNSLSIFSIRNNQFDGNFPIELSKCKSLRRAILSNNLLQGTIPSDLDINNAINYFTIRGNLLTGKIPSVFGLWSNLSMLDMSGNKLSGSIPPQLGSLQNLQILNISSNILNGSIPSELANCKKMSKLDLSGNNLSGIIPPEIIATVNLESLMLQDNKLNGFIPNYFSSSQSLFEFNLGNNMLEGPIPCSLGKLQQFYSVLNVSNNRLSGEIPKCLGNLDKLEILDLSKNNLSGEIPSELKNMISIIFVNVSFNKLSGKIPETWGKILSMYPGSFAGNPEICLPDSKSNNCGENRNYHKKDRSGILIPLTIGTVVASVVVLSLSGYLLVIFCIKNSFDDKNSFILESQSQTEDLPKDLTIDGIVREMESSSDACLIGRGKHGIVYRTFSPKNKTHWAVKKVDLSENKFYNEVRTMRMARHRNVLKMVGYCIKDGKGFMVTHFMPKGTLFDTLHKSKPQIPLNWEFRYIVALRIAQGLSYLHHDCIPQIIHRDIKSNNILLDSDMEPKIGDFGTAKFVCEPDETIPNSVIVGTLGYIAPENGFSSRLTEKCDVYSYGVILLELLCRKLPVDPSFEEGLDIVTWVRNNSQYDDNCPLFLDEQILSWETDEQLKAEKLLNLALECTKQAPDMRPSMRKVVKTIERIEN